MNTDHPDPADAVTGPRVLVGIDGSPISRDAAAWAASAAAARRVPLVIAHVADLTDGPYTYAVTPVVYSETLEAHGREYLAAAADRVRRAHPDLRVRTLSLVGSPVRQLLDHADGAVVTVLGATGRGGFVNMMLGSVAGGVVGHGRGRVAVVRPGPDDRVRTTGPVVLGVDGSPVGEAAIGAAFEEASWRDAELQAVHVWSGNLGFDGGIREAAGIDLESGVADQEELLAERLAGWREKFPDVRVRRILADGHTVRVLLRHAADAQLVVVGSHGRSEFMGALMGSVSRALIHHAPCPVLIARP